MTEPDLKRAFIAGAISALRRRAEALRARAALGKTVTNAGVVIIASEAAHALRIARDWETLADELAEARP